MDPWLWMSWRIATHDTRPASIAEVEAMSTDQVVEAHVVLDALDDARRLQAARNKDISR